MIAQPVGVMSSTLATMRSDFAFTLGRDRLRHVHVHRRDREAGAGRADEAGLGSTTRANTSSIRSGRSSPAFRSDEQRRGSAALEISSGLRRVGRLNVERKVLAGV